jgi:hypothetical protein
VPGPVSDSYDPEFGTGENADLVREAVEQVRDRIAGVIGDRNLLNIMDVVRMGETTNYAVTLSVRELRILRFALNRALESL